MLGTSGGPGATSTAPDPSWECFVDGKSIGFKTSLLYRENWWVLCETDGLSSSSHTITVNVKVKTQSFFFDSIQYVPSADANLDQSIIQVPAADAIMQYGSGWQDLRDIAKMSSSSGSKMTIDFSGTLHKILWAIEVCLQCFPGTSLTWYGLIPGDYPGKSTSATYSIDGQTPVTFQLKGYTTKMDNYNQIFFQTPTLSSGTHHLEVVHQGNSGSTPLTVEYVMIQNAPGAVSNPPPVTTASSVTGSGSSSSSSRSTTFLTTFPTGSLVNDPNPNSSVGSSTESSIRAGPTVNTAASQNERKQVPVGAIAGSAAGVIIGILLAALFFLCRRRQKRRKQFHQEYMAAASGVNPEASQHRSAIVEPFIVGPTTPATYNTYSASDTSPSTAAVATPKFAPLRYDTPGRHPQLPLSPPPPSTQSSRGSSAPEGASSDSSHHNLLASAKAREALADAEASTTSPPRSSASGPPPGLSQSQRVRRHEDSGLRLPGRSDDDWVELPPLYTPG